MLTLARTPDRDPSLIDFYSTGDPAKLEPAPSNKLNAKSSSSSSNSTSTSSGPGVEGVVARVTNEKIVLSLSDDGGKEGELGDRLRL